MYILRMVHFNTILQKHSYDFHWLSISNNGAIKVKGSNKNAILNLFK